MPARFRDLGAPARLALFAVGLAVVGGLAALAGAATGHGSVAVKDAHGDDMAMTEMSPAAQSRASGLSSVAGGYTFVPVQTTLAERKQTAFRFRILDGSGRATHAFDVDGGVRLHLIVVRRDFVGYQHVHPKPQPDGTWSVPLTLAAPGAYRAYADFEVGGKKTVLGHDLFVAGAFAPVPLPAARRVVRADGFEIALTHAALHADKATKLHFAISRNGKPVASFDDYVGHRGHLVALRDGDLSYSHVHPEPDAKVGEIVFHTELPAAGRYGLFLQFKVDGVVHTAPFTVEVAR
jgi:hypothetical protein